MLTSLVIELNCSASILKLISCCFFLLFIYSQEYISQDTVRIILNKLEKRGYKLKAMTGLGQTCIWTLHKELDDE